MRDHSMIAADGVIQPATAQTNTLPVATSITMFSLYHVVLFYFPISA